jgi:hypothetical protein
MMSDEIKRIRSVWLDSKMPPQDLRVARRDIAALCERVRALEEQLAGVRRAWNSYQGDDLDREEFEGSIAEIAEKGPG